MIYLSGLCRTGGVLLVNILRNAAQDKDLRLMQPLSLFKIKTKRNFKFIFKQFLNFQYV